MSLSVVGSQETWYGDDGKDGYDVTSPQGVGLKLGSATRTTGKLSSCSGSLRQCLKKNIKKRWLFGLHHMC